MADPAIDAATELLSAANERGGTTRVLGGIGVVLRCPSARPGAPLARAYSDIDVVTTRRAGPLLTEALEALGYASEERFNALHGHSRMIFDHPEGIHVDVFVDRFVMCHSLDLAARLELHDATLPLADLLLTKLQVAELNEKDVTDTAALLLDHELTSDETGINVGYVTSVLSADWGWWRTVSHNLRALPNHLEGRLSNDAAARVAERATRLAQLVDEAPKSLRWRLRAKAGDKLAWREEPEESH